MLPHFPFFFLLVTDSDSDDGSDKFHGQRLPTLVQYFKGILRRYPDGGQILKVRHQATFLSFSVLFSFFFKAGLSEVEKFCEKKSSLK